MAALEPSAPTTASPRYPNTAKKQEFELKSQLMMLTEDFKKDINNSLKEKQENISQQGNSLKEKTQKSLKELRKTKPVK